MISPAERKTNASRAKTFVHKITNKHHRIFIGTPFAFFKQLNQFIIATMYIAN
jgi:predicted RNase H-related nuclease YkuK (DUF458 family)